MRLDLDASLTQSSNAAAAVAATDVARVSRNNRTGSVGAGDSIRISGASSALHQLAGERSARLAALSTAVADGSYRVSGAAVGAAIIRHAGG